MAPIELVVGSHESSRLGLGHDHLKGQQVYLPQGSGGNKGVYSHALMLLIVAHQMLGGWNDVLFFHAEAIAACQRSGQ